MSDENETIVELSTIEPESYGRCRLYNSDKDIVDCDNKSSEGSCQEWARWKNAWGYSWSPSSRC